MGSWVPLLTGADADRALAVAGEIAEALTGTTEDPLAAGASLSQGLAGQALFFAALGDNATAVALADRTIDLAATAPVRPGLYAGTVGVGWALSVLERHLGEEDDGDSDVDDLVGTLLDVDSWSGAFDLILGLTGLGVYCLERLPRESARRNLDRVVAHLAALAERTQDGVAWRTGPGVMPEHRLEMFPDGYLDIGLAHGVSGVIAMLAHAARHGASGAADLVAAAVSELRTHRLPEGIGYPGIVGGELSRARSRIAWCYGDPGVAVALLAAGEVDEARALARNCANRIDENCGVADAGLCHGAAGLGHVLNRLGQALGDEQVLDQARYWFGEALTMRQDGKAVAGFPALDRTQEPPVWRPTAGVLEGAAGVGLALVSAATATEPWWDSMLLLS